MSRRVAFTFDTESGADCPHNTLGAAGWREILDILREEGVRATFFLIGSMARQEPELARRTVADGHVIGNHTNGHISLARNPRKARAQIRAGERSIRAVTGCTSKPWFRLPYLDGDTDERVLRIVHSLGFEHVKENCDACDWDDEIIRSPSELVHVVTEAAGTQDPLVVLLHSWPKHTPAALRLLIRQFRDQGAQFVAVDELSPQERASLPTHRPPPMRPVSEPPEA